MENINIDEYCRFCAEPKGADKILNLQDDVEKCNEILLKLAFVNALYVNVNSDSILPITICSVCNDSLNKAYEFLVEVKRAQEVLTDLFTANEEYLLIVSDGKKSNGFDDYLSNDAVEDRQNVEMQVLSSSPDRELQSNINHGHRELTFHTKKKPEENIVWKDEDFSKKKIKDINSWEEYPWVCAFCNIELSDLDTLRSHSQKVHGQCSAFICIYCKKDDIYNFTPYVNHVRKHRKCLKYFCQYCNIYIKNQSLMKKHVTSHTDHQNPPCERCGKIFKTTTQQKDHVQLFVPPRKCLTLTKEDHTCDVCNKEFTSIPILKRHCREIHDPNREKRHACKFCDKAFYDKPTLNAHLILHSKKRVNCHICHKKFHAKSYLKSHLLVHKNIKPFTCAECGKQFRMKRQMKIHMLIHSGRKPYKCLICDKEFRRPTNFKIHEARHTGLRPYSCTFCSWKFMSWNDCHQHMIRLHGTPLGKTKLTARGRVSINAVTPGK